MTDTAPPPPPPAPPQSDTAARAVGATKIYGEAETEVVALDDVTVEFARARFSAITGLEV